MIKAILKSVVIAGMLFSFTAAVHAEDKAQKKKKFDEKHPRRAKVLNGANTQEDNNNKAAVDGKITDAQARKLDRQDQAVKAEEQRQAAANGGHITKAEERHDMKQEANIHKERNAMEAKDAAAKSGSAPTAAGTAPAASQ